MPRDSSTCGNGFLSWSTHDSWTILYFLWIDSCIKGQDMSYQELLSIPILLLSFRIYLLFPGSILWFFIFCVLSLPIRILWPLDVLKMFPLNESGQVRWGEVGSHCFYCDVFLFSFDFLPDSFELSLVADYLSPGLFLLFGKCCSLGR